ncbi:hypothetical protein J132_10400 [Termitomyces sp. J132]|nr:hypothetical protein H2248_006788 [Termitomyces sp. 'cryptogamus']KNZ76425.1 hypothetical protein J132_10400 [Termitomyces sp. J132]
MFRSLVVLAVIAVSTVSATNSGVVYAHYDSLPNIMELSSMHISAGFPSPDLSKVKLAQRAPAPADGPYIAGFPVPRV